MRQTTFQKKKAKQKTIKKEQDKTSEQELNKMKINNLIDKDFKVILIKMLTKLRSRMSIIRQLHR